MSRASMEPYYVLVAQDPDGCVVRISTAQHTEAGREALQKQVRHHHIRAWVQTEWRSHETQAR